MPIEAYRWRPSGSFLAHLWKAATQQHHRELLPCLAPLVPRDAVVFDVGAHAGQFAKLFSRLAPAGRVWSFEPGSYARSILRAALWLNRIANVTVVPLALGDRAGTGTLTLPVKRSGAYGFGLAHLGPGEARWERLAAEPIALGTLDEFVASQGITRLDFIKADIEGWEGALLRGGRETLARFRPRLLLELDPAHLARAGDTLDGTFVFLEALGYRAHAAGADGRLVPLTTREAGDVWWLPAGEPP